MAYRGQGCWCPVCFKEAKQFAEYGFPLRETARCIHCGALERHRFVWLYFEKMTQLLDGRPKRVLHVAPERCFEARLRKCIGEGYITADLSSPSAMVNMDITDIKYPDSYFDVVYCSHVLEHVLDDRKAMRECSRVLKHDGWALLLVPITADQTFEPPIVDPLERLRVFGQKDHVRRYGPDFVDRLREAGFKVRVSAVSDLFTDAEAARMGLTSACGEIYYRSKVTDQSEYSPS